MNLEQIKIGITKEIGSRVNTIDPAIDIDICLNLYFKILKYKLSFKTKDDLDGLEKNIEKSLTEFFIDKHINSSSVGSFCKNFEPFIKKLYYILQENEFISTDNLLDNSKLHTLTPFLTTFNKIRPTYLDEKNKEVYEVELAVKKNGEPKVKINPDTGLSFYKRLYSTSLSFDKYNDPDDKELNDKYQNDFVLYLVKAVILKNEQSHQVPDRNTSKNIENLSSTLLAELWVVNFFTYELTNAFKNENYKSNDFNEYINSEISRLKKQSNKFVSLNLKELATGNKSGKSGFIEDLLDKSTNRIRILGQGGSGKTTTLEYLLYKDAVKWIDSSAKSKIPVLIYLANLSSKETLIETISKKLQINKDLVTELLKTNDLKIYLDGVNEIVENRELKKQKLMEIASLIEEYPSLSLLITDRYELDSYQNNMFPIPTFLIQKLDKTQVEDFVKKYCYNSLEQSALVLEVLNSKTTIQELLLRPLVLTRAIEIIKIDNDLPEKEGHIIEKFIESLLKREKDEKMDPLLNINIFKLLLSYAADHIWRVYRANAPIHIFTFNKLLVEAAEKFGIEKSNAGYITRIGYELEILSKNDELIQFYHQSYLEFFCKHYLKYETH